MIDTELTSQKAPAAPTRRRGWPAVAALGASLTLLLVAAIHALVREPIPPLLVIAVVAVTVLVLLGRGLARAGGIVAVLLGLFLLSDVPALLTGLALFRDPWEFTTTCTAVTAALLMVAGGGVPAYRGGAAGTGRAVPVLLGLGLLAVPAALATSTVLRLTMDQAVLTEGDVAVVITELAFPERLTAAPGPASFVVRNDDPIAHTFTVEGLDVDANVPARASVRVTGDLAPGEYDYVCRVAGHEFMRGTLVVE